MNVALVFVPSFGPITMRKFSFDFCEDSAIGLFAVLFLHYLFISSWICLHLVCIRLDSYFNTLNETETYSWISWVHEWWNVQYNQSIFDLIEMIPNEKLLRMCIELMLIDDNNASLSLFQGFFVSLFYCFLNSEVRNTLRHRFNTWRDERNIRTGQSRQSRRYDACRLNWPAFFFHAFEVLRWRR